MNDRKSNPLNEAFLKFLNSKKAEISGTAHGSEQKSQFIEKIFQSSETSMTRLTLDKKKQIDEKFNVRDRQLAVPGTIENLQKFFPGSTYKPQDLGINGQKKEKKSHLALEDVYLKSRIDLSKQYKNATFLAQFISPSGKILPRSLTNLCLNSQRKLSKGIKRARALGIIPILSNPKQGMAF